LGEDVGEGLGTGMSVRANVECDWEHCVHDNRPTVPGASSSYRHGRQSKVRSGTPLRSRCCLGLRGFEWINVV